MWCGTRWPNGASVAPESDRPGLFPGVRGSPWEEQRPLAGSLGLGGTGPSTDCQNAGAAFCCSENLQALYLEELVLEGSRLRVLWVLALAPHRVFTPVAGTSFAATLALHLTWGGVRRSAWRGRGLGAAPLGRRLEPHSEVASARPFRDAPRGALSWTWTVPSFRNLRSPSSSRCSGLLCPRPCFRVGGVARAQQSVPPGARPASPPS